MMKIFTPRAIAPTEVPAIMRTHIITGCMGSLWGTLLTGIVYIYYGNAIGMSQFQWGILGAVSLWVIVAQPFGALLAEKLGSLKKTWFLFALADRCLRLAGVVGSFLAWRAGWGWAFFILMSAVSIGSLAGTLSNPPWYGWLATIIPAERQGSFWGRRDAWVSLAVILVVVPAGLLMDNVAEPAKGLASAAILVGASCIGFADLFIHARIPEPRRDRSALTGSVAGILRPLRDRRFRPWLIFMAFWNFGWSLGGSLCTLYFMENLGFKHNLFGGMIAATAVGLAGSVLTARAGGRLVDKWGTLRVLMGSYVVWALLPLIWLLATPSTGFFWVGAAGLVGGIFPLAANNAGLKLVTRYPQKEESPMYVAVSNGAANIAAGFGSFASGAFLHAVGPWSFTVGSHVVSAFPMLFIASSGLRLLSAVLLIPRIRERGELPAAGRRLLLPLFFRQEGPRPPEDSGA
jgi:MFS family permease